MCSCLRFNSVFSFKGSSASKSQKQRWTKRKISSTRFSKTGGDSSRPQISTSLCKVRPATCWRADVFWSLSLISQDRLDVFSFVSMKDDPRNSLDRRKSSRALFVWMLHRTKKVFLFHRFKVSLNRSSESESVTGVRWTERDTLRTSLHF